MSSRQNQILELETFLKNVDTEVTMILQSLQWDRKHLTEKEIMVVCQFNTHHRVPPDQLLDHEKSCFLKSQGYTETDRLLPSPVDPSAPTLVKLDSDSIAEIINKAASSELSFKKVMVPLEVTDYIFCGCSGNQPLTLDRLQVTYTPDERRAIHEAVVNQVPSCHDLSDLALLSTKDDASKQIKPKSKLEILAELRDMKRRRTKYRVASKSRNYSDVLRDVINTQMELYNQAQDNVRNEIKKEPFLDNNERNGNSSKDDNDLILKNCDGSIQNKESVDIHSSKKDKGGYREPHYSRHYGKFESRKRSYKCEDVTPSKYMKTERYEKYDTHRSKKHSEDCASDSIKHPYSTSNKRDNRDVEISSNRERRKYSDEDSEKYKRNNEKYNASRTKSHTEHSRSEKHTYDVKDIADIRKNASTKYRDKDKYYTHTEHSLDAQKTRHKDRHEKVSEVKYEHMDEYGEEDNYSMYESKDKETFKIGEKHKKHKHHKHSNSSHVEEKERGFKKKHGKGASDSEDGELNEHISSKNKSKREKKKQSHDTYEHERRKQKQDNSDTQGKSDDYCKVSRDKYHSSDKSHSLLRTPRRRSSECDDHKNSGKRKCDAGYRKHRNEKDEN